MMNIIKIPVPQLPWQASGIKDDWAICLCHVVKNNCIVKGYKKWILWDDDDIKLLIESVNQYKCKCEYEGINWESVR